MSERRLPTQCHRSRVCLTCTPPPSHSREELAAQLATVSEQVTRLATEARVAETQKESRQANYKVHEWSPDLTGKIGNASSFPDTVIAGDMPLPGEGATSNPALRLQSACSHRTSSHGTAVSLSHV